MNYVNEENMIKAIEYNDTLKIMIQAIKERELDPCLCIPCSECPFSRHNNIHYEYCNEDSVNSSFYVNGDLDLELFLEDLEEVYKRYCTHKKIRR